MDLHGVEAAMYLRKSRNEDGLPTEEILRRHKETLTEYAAREGLRVTETFQEVKSGESLYSRPEMMKLLEAVESGRFGAVLCMDIDRLSRGETRERGLIWSAFKASGTLIVTPSKTYDLSEESDELMTELRGLFANFELRKIKERQWRGILSAAKEGNYLASAPYGYRKRIEGRKHTLEIYEPEARFVRLAFEMYASGAGSDRIASRLTEEGARPRWKEAFTNYTILKMLRNPVYVGRIEYNKNRFVRKDGKIRAVPRPESEWVVADGLHPAIVDEGTFEKVQEVLKSRWRPAYFDGSIKTPLAGIVRCKRCGGRMHSRKSNGTHYLRCEKNGCCVLSRADAVESAILDALRGILSAIEIEPDKRDADECAKLETRLASAKAAVAAESRKKARLYDFLESGTYTEAVFRERMDALEKKIDALKERERAALAELDALRRKDAARQAESIRNLLEAYESADAAGKNALLCAVVDVVLYERPTRKDKFSLEIFLK